MFFDLPIRLVWHRENYTFTDPILVNTDGTITLPQIDTVIIVCYSAVILFVILSFIYHYIVYKKGKAMIINMSKPINPDDKESKFKDIKDLNKRIKIYTSDKFEPLSMGIISPIIVIPDKFDNSYTNKNIISHELQHIKHKDFLLKVIAFVVITIHWFNPLTYFMRKELDELVEYYADECCVKNFSKEEMNSYGNDVIDFASKNKGHKNIFISTFGNSDLDLMRERISEMRNLKKYNTFGKFLAIFILLISTVCCSVVVFAYEDYPVMQLAEGQYIDPEAEHTFEVVIDPESSIYEEEMLPFTDENNVLMQIEGSDEYLPYTEAEPRASCSHSYQNITIKDHSKNSSGGCTVYIYSAKRCKKCGNTINKTYKNSLSYDICPHS